MRIGRYIAEVFRQRDICECSFYAMAPKSNEWCKGHVLYPVKINEDEYSKFTSPVLLESKLIETDCPSITKSKCNRRFFIQLNRLNKSTILGFTTYILCRKMRALYRPRKHVPKEFIEWLLKVYCPAYEFQYG